MSKQQLAVILTILLLPISSYSNGITCWGKSCTEVSEEVFLEPSSPRQVIHLHLIEDGIKIPIFGNISTISTAITTPQNSFHHVYYYGDTQSISVSFFDIDSHTDLLPQPRKISLFKKGEISVFFYETDYSKDHPQAPIFEAIIPVTRNNKDRFIQYATKGIPEEEFKTLLSKIESNTL